MRVDSNISAAIDRYLKSNGMTAKELCKKLGISEPAIIKWRRPGKGILNRNWIDLFPLIKPYLPKERFYIDENGEEQYSSTLEGTGNNQYFIPKYMPQMVPVFSLQEITDFPYIVQSVEQYSANIKSERIEYRPRTQGCGCGVFAMTVEKENEFIPKGALMFLSTDVRPKNGSVILFMDSNGDVNFGSYQLIADKYSISSTGNRIGGAVSKIREKISWIFPVLYYEVVTF